MEHNINIKGTDISLLPLNKEYSECYRKLRNRDDNRFYFFNSAIIEKEQQKRWYESYLAEKDQYMFAIIENGKGYFVGGVGIYDVVTNFEKTAQVGRIIVDKERCFGKGYGAQALKLLAQIAKNDLKLVSLYAYIMKTNIASIKTFEKAGYQLIEENSDRCKVKILL